ncbi:hypothetical protein QTJ16_006345 [Diplocarpon rosae]|uniref:CCHC-type domain-containing protein n=1 Tax=Diplocarpon rosae TaxID=946125 RepID=A0AAD9SX97_9HELO|nr:hypothetical protein QTJ16_006345 [Diplocarpon rosae]
MSMPAWSQGGQPMMQHNGRPPPSVQRRRTNPPPVCFNCGVEGHFLVACPEATRNAPAALNPTPYQPYSAPRPPAQQQYPPQGGPAQYPPLQQSTQYGPATPQYSYGQPQALPPQTYGTPQSYARPGFQPPQYNQYPTQHGPPQLIVPGYQGPPQQYGPPAPVSYQQPPNTFPTNNASYVSNFQAPSVQHQPPQQQWNPHSSALEPAYQSTQRGDYTQQSNSVKYSNSLQPGNSTQREQSGAPVIQIQKQQPQSFPNDDCSESHYQIPTMPASLHSTAQHVSRPGSQTCTDMSPEAGIEPQVSKGANASYGSYGCRDGDTAEEDSKQVSTSTTGQEQERSNKPEEGQVGEADEEDSMFKWEFKHIFMEPPVLETIELAQTLSTSVKLTPVPLIQDWNTILTSISRHARKDNLKDFIRPMHTLPQWSELKEDPVFADIDMNGPSIPLEKLGEWISNHHAETDSDPLETVIVDEETVDMSRKRPRSDASEAQDTLGLAQAYHDPGIGNELGHHPAKRQKSNTPIPVQDNSVRISNGTTPVIHRSGTPCGDIEGDDAWAPLPGESASTPQDPTEALLASLGVTGSPKPIQREPLPQYMNDLEEVPRAQSSQPSQVAQPTLNLLVNHQVVDSASVSSNATTHNQNGPPRNYQHDPQAQHGQQLNHDVHMSPQNGPSIHQHNGPSTNGMTDPLINHNNGFSVQNQHGLLINNQHGSPVNHQNGPFVLQHGHINQQYGVRPQHSPQYGANNTYRNPQNLNSPAQNTHPYGLAHAPYSNGPPQNLHGPNQYGPGPGPPANAPYVNGQQNNYVQSNNFPQQGPPQWGLPQNQAYSHGHPVNTPQAYPHQAPPTSQQYNNPQYTSVENTPGPFQPQQQATSQQLSLQQGPQQYGQPQGQQQHSQPRNQSFSNRVQMPSTFASQQGSPTDYGHSQNRQFANQFQNSGPQSKSNHGLPSPYAPHNNIPQMNGSAQQSFSNGLCENVSLQQDLRSMNGHGSYSNSDSVQDAEIQSSTPQSTSQPAKKGTPVKEETALKQEQNILRVKMDWRDSDSAGSGQASDETGTPLSPESAMILGKLERKPDRTSYGEHKPGEKRKLSQSVVNARKKRPQPEVAEAYGRRW